MTCFYLPCDINKAVFIKTNQVLIEIRGVQVKSKGNYYEAKFFFCYSIYRLANIPYYIPGLKGCGYIGLVGLLGVSLQLTLPSGCSV